MGTWAQPGNQEAQEPHVVCNWLFPLVSKQHDTKSPGAGSPSQQAGRRRDHTLAHTHCITVSRGLGISGKQMRSSAQSPGPQELLSGLEKDRRFQFLAGKRQVTQLAMLHRPTLPIWILTARGLGSSTYPLQPSQPQRAGQGCLSPSCRQTTRLTPVQTFSP